VQVTGCGARLCKVVEAGVFLRGSLTLIDPVNPFVASVGLVAHIRSRMVLQIGTVLHFAAECDFEL
jgi:hypothetical protein